MKRFVRWFVVGVVAIAGFVAASWIVKAAKWTWLPNADDGRWLLGTALGLAVVAVVVAAGTSWASGEDGARPTPNQQAKASGKSRITQTMADAAGTEASQAAVAKRGATVSQRIMHQGRKDSGPSERG